MTYTVIATIQTTLTDSEGEPTNAPVDVQWYKGDNLPAALAALVQCAVRYDDDPCYVMTHAVRMDIS